VRRHVANVPTADMQIPFAHTRPSNETRPEKLDQLSNFRRCRCSNHSGDCDPSMGEHYACSQQSRTKRNTGINGARPNPTASRSHHRNGALTANMWSNPAANQPAEETSPFRQRCQQRARLQTKATLDSVEHRLCGLDLVISARRRSFNVDNDCACGQDWARSQLRGPRDIP
jgi:hypothetical protein